MKPNELNEVFANSDYGRILENNIRFGDFKPEYISNQIWEQLLGDDVNNLRHMQDTYKLTRRFMRAGDIGSELLKLTAITHDWGEAIVGDIALPDKEANPDLSITEAEAFRAIAKELLGHDSYILDEVPDVLWGEHELSEPFRVIEFIGYCRTGIRAGLAADAIAHGWLSLPLSRAHREGVMGGLYALNKAVELHNFKILTGYMDKYPYITKVLYR